MPKRNHKPEPAPTKRQSRPSPLAPVEEIPIPTDCWSLILPLLSPEAKGALKCVSKACCALVKSFVTTIIVGQKIPDLKGDRGLNYLQSLKYKTRGPAWWLSTPKLKTLELRAVGMRQLPSWLYYYWLNTVYYRSQHRSLELILGSNHDHDSSNYQFDFSTLFTVLYQTGPARFFNTIRLVRDSFSILGEILFRGIEFEHIEIICHGTLCATVSYGAGCESMRRLMLRLENAALPPRRPHPNVRFPDGLYRSTPGDSTMQYYHARQLRELYPGRILEGVQ